MILSDEYKFCPRCGKDLIRAERYGRIRPVCTHCGWIYFADPKVAAAVLVLRGGRVLLVRRVNPPYKGEWSLPAGFIDAGEDPGQAAERECLEETGLRVRAVKLLDVLSGREHPRGADFVLYYLGEVISGELQPGDDADAVDFFPLDNLPPIAFQLTRRFLKDLQEKQAPA